MGRLENIASRNRHPWKLRGMLSFGLRSLFLLVILGLLVFTKWGLPPKDERPGINVVPAPAPRPAPADDHAIHGVKLWKPPAKGSAAQRP